MINTGKSYAVTIKGKWGALPVKITGREFPFTSHWSALTVLMISEVLRRPVLYYNDMSKFK